MFPSLLCLNLSVAPAPAPPSQFDGSREAAPHLVAPTSATSSPAYHLATQRPATAREAYSTSRQGYAANRVRALMSSGIY